ncbi:uncharacterized protein J4E84_002032 [Alternaria hordeiaustralica]|uniref:uncharacterized protein n=1 Tax=Alternaria hordeiaustralica TaxID=1187925 RepID=UPI0020C51377|nr:uncharacterized protein J4E84_002032 [Alternaria hordeiaustralica]KAI4695406.1 hypothetical protein J4E84_002032 [Alternaria hordeiaustralica]
MTWPPPNPGGVNLQFIAEAQQIINSHNQHHAHQPSFTHATGGHAPITNDEIESEAAFNAQFTGPPVLLDYDTLTGAGSSSGGYSAHRLHGQSPQTGGSSSAGKAEAPSKATLETRKGIQARGKNWNSFSGEAQGRAWEERQKRDEAVSILESEEMLMWIAGVRNESVPQTRAFYRNIVLGLSQPDADWKDEWEVQGTGSGAAEGQVMAGSGSPARSGKGKERDIAKMRKRVSSGQGTA